jgi:flagellar hook-associated protein 3 FlgL
MRVTERSFISSFLDSIGRGRERLNRLNEQLGAQKRILRPSDDPAGTETVLRVDGQLDRIEKYTQNVQNGKNTLQASMSVLKGIGSALQSAKELANGVASVGDPALLTQAADQIDKWLNTVVDLANTQFDGRYIFAGTSTAQAPFVLDAASALNSIQYRGNSIPVQFQVGEGAFQSVTISGQDAFMGAGPGADVFSTLISIRDTLRAGGNPSPAQLTALADAQKTIMQTESQAGTMAKMLDIAEATLGAQREQLLQLRSGIMDVDLAEVGMKLKYEETMLDAALAAGAKILPKSLLDFLK